MSSLLVDYWKTGDFIKRQKLQKIAFPMGVTYDKEKAIYRTLCVNEVFRVIRAISCDYNEGKQKSDFDLSSKSPFVEKSDELSDRFFQDLRLIEDYLKSQHDAIIYP